MCQTKFRVWYIYVFDNITIVMHGYCINTDVQVRVKKYKVVTLLVTFSQLGIAWTCKYSNVKKLLYIMFLLISAASSISMLCCTSAVFCMKYNQLAKTKYRLLTCFHTNVVLYVYLCNIYSEDTNCTSRVIIRSDIYCLYY